MSLIDPIEITETDEKLQLAWDNRKVRKERFAFVFLVLFWIVWAPSTLFLTGLLFMALDPCAWLFLAVWCVGGWFGTLVIPYILLKRRWFEWVEISAEHITLGTRGFLAPRPRTYSCNGKIAIALGWYNYKGEHQSMTSLTLLPAGPDGFKGFMFGYWLAPQLKKQVFDTIKSFVDAKEIAINLTVYGLRGLSQESRPLRRQNAMKVNCPRCSALVPATNISLNTGWSKCEKCQELFQLGETVPGYPATGPSPAEKVQRPINARAVFERTRDKLMVDVPPEGMRAATLSLLGLATIWLGFMTFWTIAVLGVFAGQPLGQANWQFACCSIPFWLAGLGMMGVVAWSAWGRRSVKTDEDGMRTQLRCLLWSRKRWIELDRVQHAQSYEAYLKNQDLRACRAVEIVFRGGSFVLPVDSAAEERWLIAEINDFLKSVGR